MGNRLTRITTHTGDDGTTGLADGSRLPKHAPRVEAMGELDELNATLGVLLAEPLDGDLGAALREVQNDLFELGAVLAVPGRGGDLEPRVRWLEETLEGLNAHLPPLREFVLPGGARPAALCHLARTQCRRAERRWAALLEAEPALGAGLHYLNRLSDLLFVAARTLNRRARGEEVCWRPRPAPE